MTVSQPQHGPVFYSLVVVILLPLYNQILPNITTVFGKLCCLLVTTLLPLTSHFVT